jgi:drug/metabolite transporter (DMT)-like permease
VLVLGGAVLHLGERVTLGKGAGVLLAFSGVVLVLSAQGLSLAHGTLRGDLVTLVAVFAWAAYTVAGKPLLARYDAVTVTAWVFGFGAVLLLPLAPFVLRGFDPSAPGLRGWSEVAYLSVMTSGVAFTLWYFALHRLEASQVAVFSNLQAPLTALLAWLFLGAVPEHEAIVGGALVLGGVTLVQLAGRARPSGRALRPSAPRSDSGPLS